MLLTIQDHARVVQDPIPEIAIRRKSGIVDILDVITANRVIALVSTLPLTSGLVISAANEQLMTDVAVCGYPHSRVFALLHLKPPK
jgi:hypothetical protein